MATRDMGKEFVARITDSMSRSEIIEEEAKGKIAAAILIRRGELHMNQIEFAKYMGVSQAMVSKWEGGECNFSLSAISNICEKLGLVLDISLTKEAEYRKTDNGDWMKLTRGGGDEAEQKKQDRRLFELPFAS